MTPNDRNTLEICLHKEAAVKQRIEELARGLGVAPINGYDQTGCYDCVGYMIGCKSYFPKNFSIPESHQNH